MPCEDVQVRDLSELLKKPRRLLTDNEKENFDACMPFKNRDVSLKSSPKMNLEDILKLRGKYAGYISVERFLKQKREDVALEERT